MSMYGLNLLLTSGYENSLSLIFSIVIGILGYVGLILLLVNRKTKLNKVLTILLLLSGIFGFVLFMYIEGGEQAWHWMINMEEPFELLILLFPVVVSLLFLTIEIKSLFRKSF
jgi:hypothetical protein